MNQKTEGHKKTFDALDWIAQLATHIPELTYDDFYSQLLPTD
jgi:hypothetical protein